MSKCDKEKVQIHCPVEGCIYAEGSQRYFANKKFLAQHTAKVHAEKKYLCIKCSKGFGLDWWRKHHEKTCGTEWKCECGLKYSSREGLLTHARRNQHQLPEHILHTDKKRKSKIDSKVVEKPLIVILQPIIQNVTCVQPLQANNSVTNPRPILPKAPRANIYNMLPLSSNYHQTLNALYTVNSSSSDNLTFCSNSMRANDNCNLYTIEPFAQESQASNLGEHKINAKKFKKVVAETQTSNEFSLHKTCQSQASQCSGRSSKSLRKIESTHTQTAESTVVKIKRKIPNRSRRKSIAITTESNMVTDINLSQGLSIWPGIKDVILNSSNTVGNKNSVSTQTNASNLLVCDSQTSTSDIEFLDINWNDQNRHIKDNINENFEILSEIAVEDSLSTLPQVLENNNLPVLNMLSNTSLLDNTFCLSENQKNGAQTFQNVTATSNFSQAKCSIENSLCPVENSVKPLKETYHNSSTLENNLSHEACSLFASVFNECPQDANNNKDTAPSLSDIYTQTISANDLDYNLLAHMETQTTDDCIFSELEFSDTETQTAWDDFPDIDNSPLPTDQLSIEIQTDFSSFDTSINQDPYELINNMDMQNIIGCSDKEALGVNIETQTQELFTFPQFTNSESQTLDIPSFRF